MVRPSTKQAVVTKAYDRAQTIVTSVAMVAVMPAWLWVMARCGGLL